jgi:hypothetical protein
VLTSWASGSGLQRAFVVGGGSPESPNVRYLDLSLENPAAHADTDDRLPPNTFQVIREPGQVGSSLACRTADRVERIIVVKRAGTQLLGLGFAGKLRAFASASCVALALVPSLETGDRVYAAMLGGFVDARVEKLDLSVGRVFVRLAFAGKEKIDAVGFTNVAVALPPR